MNEIGAARADVRAEDVGAVALVVHPAGDARARVVELLDVAKQIDRSAADRGQENLQIQPGHELREHAAGLLEQCAPQAHLGRAEAFRNSRQIPDRVDGDFHDPDAAVAVHDRAVAHKAAVGHAFCIS